MYTIDALLLAVVLLCPSPTAAVQLRPLDPLDWGVLEGESTRVSFGGGVFFGQRASLSGTEGRLLELGAYRASWSTGRVAVELSGTVHRIFGERSTFAEPVGGARPSDGTSRSDTGDHRVSTTVALTSTEASASAAFRFGVRLPTTNNSEGLERDQMDFFSTLAGRLRLGELDLQAEVGLGVNGTRNPVIEQVDPLIYAFRATLGHGLVVPVLVVVGQYDTRPTRDLRGTENLGEVRFGIRSGKDRWISVTGTRGWTAFSPELGLSISTGARF